MSLPTSLPEHLVRRLKSRELLLEARRLWETLGYIPYTLAEDLRRLGYTKQTLEHQFSLGAQA